MTAQRRDLSAALVRTSRLKLDLNPYLVRAVHFFINAWQFPLLRNRWGKLLLVSAAILICAMRAYVGLVGSRLVSRDAFMLFDGA